MILNFEIFQGSRDRRYDDDDLPGPSSRNGNGSDLANLKPSKALEHEAFTRRRMMTRKELHQELLDKVRAFLSD